MGQRGAGGARPGEGLGRDARVRRRSEYQAIQSRGRRVHTPHFVLILLPSERSVGRLGITVTRKVGSAVSRNRVKRLVREVWRRNRRRFPEGFDVVFIAKQGAPELDYHRVADEVARVEDAMRAAARRAERDGRPPSVEGPR